MTIMRIACLDRKMQFADTAIVLRTDGNKVRAGDQEYECKVYRFFKHSIQKHVEADLMAQNLYYDQFKVILCKRLPRNGQKYGKTRQKNPQRNF